MWPRRDVDFLPVPSWMLHTTTMEPMLSSMPLSVLWCVEFASKLLSHYKVWHQRKIWQRRFVVQTSAMFLRSIGNGIADMKTVIFLAAHQDSGVRNANWSRCWLPPSPDLNATHTHTHCPAAMMVSKLIYAHPWHDCFSFAWCIPKLSILHMTFAL